MINGKNRNRKQQRNINKKNQKNINIKNKIKIKKTSIKNIDQKYRQKLSIEITSGEAAEENEPYRTKQFGNETGVGIGRTAMARVLWRDVYFFDRRLHGIDRLG